MLSSIRSIAERRGSVKWVVAVVVAGVGFDWVEGEGVLLCAVVSFCSVSSSGSDEPCSIAIKMTGSRSTTCMLQMVERCDSS